MSKIVVKIFEKAGEFAENKDVAKTVRENIITPALSNNQQVVLDFHNVSGSTQSFIHALISDPIRKFQEIAFDNLYYENTTPAIREIISIVYRYMQESLD